MAVKNYLPLHDAAALAERIVGCLQPYCHRLAVAGSIRRQRPHVGDLDLVALPSDRAGLIARLTRHTTTIEAGGQNVTVRLDSIGFEIGLYIAREAEADLFGQSAPCNFGTLLLLRTGSREHNVHIAATARQLGLHWSPYKGLIRPEGTAFVDYSDHGRRQGRAEIIGPVIASETEEEIFTALGLDYVPPKDRL